MRVAASDGGTSSPDQIAEEPRKALRDLILSLADSKRILGIRYADWVLGAPELEASIASSSIAQDEWGHSRMLYALLKDFGDDPEQIEHERDASDYRSIQALDEALNTWPDFVVANAVIDTTLTIQLEALVESDYAPLRQRVNKQLDEERFHFGHGAAWFRRLGKASEGTRTSLQAALEARWPAILAWWGPDDYGTALKEAHLCNGTGGELKARFLERVTPMITESGLKAPAGDIDLAGWDPSTRRTSTVGPDSDAVARARGDRNRAFLMD